MKNTTNARMEESQQSEHSISQLALRQFLESSSRQGNILLQDERGMSLLDTLRGTAFSRNALPFSPSVQSSSTETSQTGIVSIDNNGNSFSGVAAPPHSHRNGPLDQQRDSRRAAAATARRMTRISSILEHAMEILDEDDDSSHLG